MKNEIKFIKNFIKELDKYQNSLNLYKNADNSIDISMYVLNQIELTPTIVEKNKKLLIEIENILMDIMFNDSKKMITFKSNNYVYPLKTLIKNLKVLPEKTQEKILNHCFSYQNTHDFILADPTNSYLYKYVKSPEAVDSSNKQNSYYKNNAIDKLAISLRKLIKDNLIENPNKMLMDNLDTIVKNYNLKGDIYGIPKFINFLTAKCSKEVYQKFNSIINAEKKESVVDIFNAEKDKYDYYFELDVNKVEQKFILLKNSMAKYIFKNTVIDFFKKNKELHNITECKIFETNKELNKLTWNMVFTSDKLLSKEEIKKDVLFYLECLDKKYNFNDMPKGTFQFNDVFISNILEYMKVSFMHRNLSSKIETKEVIQNEPKKMNKI